MNNDKLTYLMLNTRLTKFSENINLIISNIKSFENICSSALVLNDSTSYKNDVVSMKNSIDNQKEKIDNDILTELNKIC